MSSLCCAVAVCRVATPMHPKQNLAAANRYGAPLFLRKSHQRVSLPFLCSAIHVGAVPCHCYASLRFSFALPVCASQCRCSALRRRALPCSAIASPRCSVLLIAAAQHCFALPRFAFASLSLALPLPIYAPHGPAEPLPFCSLHCRCASSQIMAMPLQCKSLLRYAQPSHGQSNSALPWQRRDQRCDALALRPSPHKQCR